MKQFATQNYQNNAASYIQTFQFLYTEYVIDEPPYTVHVLA